LSVQDRPVWTANVQNLHKESVEAKKKPGTRQVPALKSSPLLQEGKYPSSAMIKFNIGSVID
jgi:hypothetical protein